MLYKCHSERKCWLLPGGRTMIALCPGNFRKYGTWMAQAIAIPCDDEARQEQEKSGAALPTGSPFLTAYGTAPEAAVEELMGMATRLSETWLAAFDTISLEAPTIETTRYWEMPPAGYDFEGRSLCSLAKMLGGRPRFAFFHAVNHGGPEGSFAKYYGTVTCDDLTREDWHGRSCVCWGAPNLVKREAMANFTNCWAAVGAMLSKVRDASWEVMLDGTGNTHRMNWTRDGFRITTEPNGNHS